MKNLALLISLVFTCFISCENSIDVATNSFSEYQKVKSEVFLYDKNRVAYRFNIKYENNVAICDRSIVGTYTTSNSHGKRFESFITDHQAFYDFSKQGKLWFIPNSNDAPKKIILNSKPASNLLIPRTNMSGTFSCFCEDIGSDPQYGGDCILDEQGDMCYAPPGPNVCGDCDIEYCPDPPTSAGIPETRGGGIFIFADTVICINSNTNVVFGGRTKIKFNLIGDTLFFNREYIYPTDIFGQYYFNATGLDLTSALDSSSWIIPFDLGLSASSSSGFKCYSNTSNPCNAGCIEESQPNGCYRCKCSGTTGDCDYGSSVTNDPTPFGILVLAKHVSEIQ